MTNQRIIGTVEKTQVSFRSIKIIDSDGNIRIASFGEPINEGDRIFSDDSTAIIEVKYDGFEDIVTYEGVFNVLAEASVIEVVDEDENLVEADTDFTDMETAAGAEGISASSAYMEFDTQGETVNIRDVNRESDSILEVPTSLNGTSDGGLNIRSLITDSELPTNNVYESNLLNLGAGEHSTYVGEKIVTEFLDIQNVEFSDISLVMTTHDPYLVAIAEKFKDIENQDIDVVEELIQNMILDFKNSDFESPTSEQVTVEIPSRGVAILQDNNFINIGMLPTGEYQITSPLFNAMGVGDSIEVSMNYSVNGGSSENISVKVLGENDTPVALDGNQNITLNDDGGYIGALPGTGAYSASLLKNIYDSANLDNGVSNVIDVDVLTQEVGTDIKNELDIKLDSTLITSIEDEVAPLVFKELVLDSVSVVEVQLNDDSQTFNLQNAVGNLIFQLETTDDKSQLFEDFGEELNNIYDGNITQVDLDIIEDAINNIKSDMESKLSDFDDAISNSQTVILDDINLDTLLKDLGINNESLNDALSIFRTDIKNELVDFSNTVDASSLNDPAMVAQEFNVMLDNVFNDVDKMFVNIIGTDTELKTLLTDTLAQSIIKTTGTSSDDELMMEIIDTATNKIMESIDISVDDITESTLENLFQQLGIDQGFLNDSSREVIGNKIVLDIFERLSMDEDMVDLATLSYSLVEGSVALNGVSVSDDMVNINDNGSYVLNTQGLSIDASKLTFDYTVNDGNSFNGISQESSQSEPKTMTINIEDNNISRAPAYEESGSIDLSTLIETINSVETMELDNENSEISISIEDVIDITNDNNELLIISSDEAEASVHLDEDFEKVTSQDGVITYEGEAHGESVMLTIEDTIHID